MSAYNSGLDGGFDFNTTVGNRRSQPDSDVLFDDNNYQPQRRAGQAQPVTRTENQPRRRPEYDDGLDDSFDDDFDDYRPGQMMITGRPAGAYQKLQRDYTDDNVFDDDDFGDSADFDNDFDDPALGRSRRTYDESRAGSRMGYTRYNDDYTDDDYAMEFSGIKGIGSHTRAPSDEPRDTARSSTAQPQRRAPQGDYPSQRRIARDDYEEYDDYDDPDGYYGGHVMCDHPYDGNGVPRIFAQYFRDDDYGDAYDEYDRPRAAKKRPPKSASRGTHNQRRGVMSFSQRKALTAVLSVLAVAAAVGLTVGYFTYFRSNSPLNVATALTAMESAVSDSLLKASVDEQLASKTISVEVNGVTSSIPLSSCEFQFSTDADGTQEKVWGKTVTGSDVEYTYSTRGSVRFNETKLKDFLHEASGNQGIRMIEPDYNVKIRQDRETKLYSGTLSITAGTNGYGIDFDTFITTLLARISNDDYSTIPCELTNTVAPAVDVDKIYSEVHKIAADAYKMTDGSGKVTYVEEVVGVDFDKTAATQKVAAGGTEWTINLSLTIPKVSRKALMADTFPDLLATYSTAFNAGNQARSSNLALAGDYINGTILQPQEVFSFNKTVGERTKERGFCKATVYSSEGTDEDYGGGICQTNSTLFYCAMKANLELVKRTNHMYTVGYMVDENGKQCFANDATVNWGTTDCQFRNNKEYPIKIECVVTTGVITFNIWGTWDGYTAEYRYVEKATERYPIIYRKYKEGKKNQAGQLGRTIWTYRVVFYQEDPDVGEREEVDRYREYESIYRPLSQVKYVTSPPSGYEFDVSY